MRSDAHAGELRCATGTPGEGGKTLFALKSLAQPGKLGGFFPQLVPGTRQIVSHWRTLARETQTYTGDVSILEY